MDRLFCVRRVYRVSHNGEGREPFPHGRTGSGRWHRTATTEAGAPALGTAAADCHGGSGTETYPAVHFTINRGGGGRMQFRGFSFLGWAEKRKRVLQMKKPIHPVSQRAAQPLEPLEPLGTAERAAAKPKRRRPGAAAADADADAATAQRPDGASAAAPAMPPAVERSRSFPIVGIGASAGGLAAFEAFFSGMPVDVEPGMAFVLVQHLAPDHKSLLCELIRRFTRMEVFEVVDGMAVRPNCAYIIPPNHDMALLNNRLQLLAPAAPRGHRLPIDFFFRSLAETQRELAIGIVLSGTGSDGTLGVRAIKGEGGMVMAQTPESTEFDGMPASAIATGLVDYELPPAEMPAQLIAYAAHAFGRPGRLASHPVPEADNSLQKIFLLLRSQTGHDFSQYKPSTIHRRIDRRMAIHQIEAIHSYLKYLQQTPAEVEALFRDMLIGVTRFFRDPEAFQVLEERILPQIFADKPAASTIRVWCAGCSTGEEAYSLAILLQERAEALKLGHKVQVFATDIDRQAVATARSGLYPVSIAADLKPERLARFFTAVPDSGTYRIHRAIRDLLVFSEQDVIKDPPFSKLDLISCRNLLIYLGADLQKNLIALFHYALNPRGFLFLGTSEGVSEHGELFTVLDRKAKVYQRKDDYRTIQRLALGPLSLATRAPKLAASHGAMAPATPRKPPLRELTEQMLLQHVAPACALVNREGDILYLHGRTGMFFEPTPGEAAVNNILRMARDGLRPGLATTLHHAADTNQSVRCPNLKVKTNGHFTLVNLTIRPVISGHGASPEAPLYLVILEEVIAAEPLSKEPVEESRDLAADAEASTAALRQELQAKDEYLRATQEELETSNEELKSSNEEMQSVNEELQSANEELETSKEEMQSINEELTTVNTELQTKVVELSRANNDMNNLLAGTGIGSVFVDHHLRILRFTPAAAAVINLIPSDIGRPVGHLVPNLVGYNRLVADAQEVLDTLAIREVDVLTQEGRFYRLRIQPYRTLDNVIEGVVLTFVDVTELKETEMALRNAVNGLLRLAVVRDAHDALTVQDLDGRTLAWNPGAVRMYGWSEAEALLLNARNRIPQELRAEEAAKLQALDQAEILAPYRTQRINKDGAVVEVWLTATALVDEAGKRFGVATTEHRIAPE